MSYVTKSFDSTVERLLKDGGIGFMPADTVYGITCRALNQTAVERIYRFKYRFENKPFIVLISDISDLRKLKIDPEVAKPAMQYWPGSLTYVCQAPKAPQWLQLGTETLAVRLPEPQKLRALIKKVGPIVSTSANLYARRPASSLTQAMYDFGDKLDFYVNVGKIDSKPSTIVKLNEGHLEILRQGTVKIR